MMFALWEMFYQSHYWPLWWTIFSTSTSFTALKKEVVHHPWCTCSYKHLKSPFYGLFEVILSYSTPSGFSRDDLFINCHNFFRFYFQTIRLYHSNNGRTLNSLWCLFLSFNELSTRWIEPHKYLYLFLDNVSAITLTLLSTTQ